METGMPPEGRDISRPARRDGDGPDAEGGCVASGSHTKATQRGCVASGSYTKVTQRGMVFDIQRFSIHDGPGIRTTVFMKGCPLRCGWCHNPESMSPKPALSFQPERCIGCGQCFRKCERGAHRMVDERHVLDRGICRACGECATECYAKALEMVGREMSVGEVLDEVLRDLPFYETSGGGLTLSGGEPLMQIAFAEALLRSAKEAGLHTCVDTSGSGDYGLFERVRPHVDLFLFDYKETDPERHREYTGVTNERILANLRALHDSGAAIRLRCPLVGGLNDRPDHLEGIARLASELPGLEAVEILPYHRLGEGKLARMGLEGLARAGAAVPEQRTVDEWVDELERRGVKVTGRRTTSSARPAGS